MISRPEEEKKNKEREKRLAFYFEDGSKYNGEWIGNKRDGYGVMEWKGKKHWLKIRWYKIWRILEK